MCMHIRFVTFSFLVLTASRLGIHHRIAKCKVIQDCLGLHAVDSGFHGLDSSICQWTLDFGFQSIVGFRIPWAVLWIPEPGIPDSRSKIFPHSGFHRRTGADPSYVSGKLPTYSFPKPTFLGEGLVGSSPERYNDPQELCHDFLLLKLKHKKAHCNQRKPWNNGSVLFKINLLLNLNCKWMSLAFDCQDENGL